MSNSIGSLHVTVSAEGSKLAAGLEHSKHLVAEFSHEVSHIGTHLIAHLAEIGAILGVGFGVHKLHELMESLSKTAKTADRLGITAAALQSLRFAAAQTADMAGGEFDSAISSMTKNVGLAAQGAGRAQKAFIDLGIDAKKLATLTPENQMKVLAEAFAAMHDPARAAADATRIFGDAAMLPMLAHGAEGIEELQKKCKELGGTITQVDAAKIEEANDAFGAVGVALTGVAQQLIVQLAPWIKLVADEFTEWTAKGKSWGEIMTTAAEWVATSIAYISEGVAYAQMAWAALKAVGVAALVGMLAPLNLLIKGIDALIQSVAGYLPDSFVAAHNQAMAFVDSFSAGLIDLVKESAEDMKALWNAPSKVDTVTAYFNRIRAEAQKAAEHLADHKPKDSPFDESMVENTRLAAAAMDDAAAAAQKIHDINFGDNKLVRAGSAEGQASVGRAFTATLDRRAQVGVDLAKQQLAESKKQTKLLQKSADTADEDELADIVG